MIEIKKAIRNDGCTVHIIDRQIDFNRYVVCWNFDGKTWDWGTYLHNLEDAEKVYKQKCKVNGFCHVSA